MFQIRFNSIVSDEINPLITELVQLRFLSQFENLDDGKLLFVLRNTNGKIPKSLHTEAKFG